MRGQNYYSSASMSDYILWVMKDRIHMSEKDIRDYRRLINVLTDIEYVWIHPMDENRAIDGIELRSDFEYETGEYLDKSSGLMPVCTFFEMLAALAIRCENQLMRNLSIGDRTSRWFFEFVNNLGLGEYTDRKWKGQDEQIVRRIIEDFMEGKYKENGSGSMFPLKKRGINQRNEQLWKQLTAYLNENYIYEGTDDMALFKR